MTLFLASVRDPGEARAVLAGGADIVDLKDPAQGALGAVAPETVRACVAEIAGRVPVSATVGDLPMDPAVVGEAVRGMAALGVDDVKLGVMPGGEPKACFARLRAQDRRAGLILVFFADAMPDFDPIAAALEASARGVMLDTAGKGGNSLLDHMGMPGIAGFVDAARRAGLIVGVAGALRPAHVAPLLALTPDVMGFRGALCCGGARVSALDPVACTRIRTMIPARTSPKAKQIRTPHAAAVC